MEEESLHSETFVVVQESKGGGLTDTMMKGAKYERYLQSKIDRPWLDLRFRENIRLMFRFVA